MICVNLIEFSWRLVVEHATNITASLMKTIIN